MYLKKIDTVGFKSFAEKTAIHFSNGITAIVGPNGCGKTNILDALRWVLGEQRVSLLRGSKMEEVIFNGTRDVKPLGMAEVTLSIVNDRGVLATEYHEVQITRRLFRSGESEYLLNKVPCRLKDITELFYDTGAGAHSYSVIEQGMIDAVISDKAEERRLLFEEAAGITKYKQRKKAALRKLESTANDFLRLNDIYAEVKTRVNSLRRQQKKAERYQKLVDDIKEWDIYLTGQKLKKIESSRKELISEHQTLSDSLDEHQTKIDSHSADFESKRSAQIDLEQELTKVSGEVFEETETAHGYEKQLSVLSEKRTSATSLIERNSDDIKALQTRSEILGEQASDARLELTQKGSELDQLKQALGEAEAKQKEADASLLGTRTSREDKNKQLLKLEGRLSSGKTEDESLRAREQELSEEKQQLIAAVSAQTEKLQNAQREFEQCRTEHDTLKNRLGELERARQNLLSRIEELTQSNEDKGAEVADVNASVEACQARLSLLEDMIVHYEGYESGVVSVMEARHRWPSLAGTVAEKITAQPGMETAVEAALGELAGFVICGNRETAEDIIGFLKSEKKGRIGILVPHTGSINPVVKRPEIDLDCFIGWLDTFVTAEDSLAPLVKAILSRTAVFKAGTDPSPLMERLPFGFQAVSTEGIVYGSHTVSGGADESFPLLRRREKLDEEENSLQRLRETLTLAKQERDQLSVDMASARADLKKTTEDMQSGQEEMDQATRTLDEKGFLQRTIQSELTRVSKENNEVAERLSAIQNRQYSLGLDFGQLTAEKDQLMGDMSKSEQQLAGLEQEALSLAEKVSRTQVELVEARGQMEQLEIKIKHAGELGDELNNVISDKEQEIANARRELEDGKERKVVLEQGLKEAFDRRKNIIERQNELRATQSDKMQAIDTIEKSLKELRSDKDSLSTKVHQLDIQHNNTETEIRAAAERIRNEYDLDIFAVELTRPDETITDETAEQELATKSENLKNFGAVNLLALEEFREANEREIFLREQLEDLSKAKDDLHTTINKINQTARELFLDTFEKARANFRNLFVELFTGGEADIYLTDPSDPLESNLEIVARPRGKRTLSIGMMSGGERALTAISLLFSLYLVKPSPFCILDEVDAPLDDANCRRFLKIIKKFSHKTQFIIITHNKISMEAADNLYGVTMEQPGISKLVAVRFAASGEAGDGRGLIDTYHADMKDDQEGEDTIESSEADPLPAPVVERLTPKITGVSSGASESELTD